MKNKPDFLVIGAMKSGTTTLYSDLVATGSVVLPATKEPRVLTRDIGFAEHSKIYQKLYGDVSDSAICGDPSTAYALRPLFEGIAARAFNLCGPDLKLVYLMRDPVSRALSHVRHDVAVGRINRIEASDALNSDVRYRAASDYCYQLEPWIKLFGMSRIHALSFEKYIKHRAETIDGILEFLDAPLTCRKFVFDGTENKNSRLIALPGFVDKIANSDWYNLTAKKYVPQKTRDIVKNIVARKRNNTNVIEISPGAVEKIAHELKSVIADTESLLERSIF